MAAPEDVVAVNRVGRIDDWVRVKTVLMSVSDKTGLEDLARRLLRLAPDISLLSTGGTYSALEKSLGVDAVRSLRQVSDYTGQPEMQGGLVKTLDFKIYLGLLSETYNPAHTADLSRAQAVPIDMVVVNLYPFETTVASAGTTLEDARANIDIGGPCMVRAAAKNFHRVIVLADPADYPAVLDEMAAHHGAVSLATRYRLAQKAFRLIVHYDEAISGYLDSASLEESRGIYEISAGGSAS